MSVRGDQLPHLVTAVPGPASQALAQRLARVESRNVTDLGGAGPIFWKAAAGSNVQDVDGNVFLDLSGAFGVAAVGHAQADVARAVSAQAEELLHGMGDIHPTAIKVRLLEALASLAPWQNAKSVLANSGSEAVEVALKTALLATGRPGILAFEGGYHGLTLGSLSVTHRDHFRAPFADRTYGDVHFVPFPNGEGKVEVEEEAESESEAGVVLELVASTLAQHPDVGAVIVEPIQGRAGVRLPPSRFLAGLADVVHAAGALLIADEIFTGFGRTGSVFASVADGCVPDLICAGKALGGGMPLSVCMGSESVMEAWPLSTGEAIHTSTFLGHPGACASALATIAVLEDQNLVERASTEGARWTEELSAALETSSRVRQVRGRGMMIGIELTEAGEREFSVGAGATTRLLERGLLLLPAGERGEVLELTPPLVITREQMDHATAVLSAVLK